MTATAPPLETDLVAGLKRLQLAHFRAVAAETLQTATTQRWTPEALLRALIDQGRNAPRNAESAASAGRVVSFPPSSSACASAGTNGIVKPITHTALLTKRRSRRAII